jgi:hypothetical protein
MHAYNAQSKSDQLVHTLEIGYKFSRAGRHFMHTIDFAYFETLQRNFGTMEVPKIKAHHQIVALIISSLTGIATDLAWQNHSKSAH